MTNHLLVFDNYGPVWITLLFVVWSIVNLWFVTVAIPALRRNR